jgi:UDP-N-acetyl-D-mannosaminuronic acid dehydrogenase
LNKVQNTILVIGLGRVGLPLLLYLEKKKFNLIGLDTNETLINNLKKKILPFREKGCKILLKKSKANFVSNYEKLNPKTFRYIFITVGTPLRENIEVNLDYINLVINNLTKFLLKGHVIILRSTVGPETTEYFKKRIQGLTKLKFGKDIFLSFCPERIAENKALKELNEQPQIVGVEDNKTFKLVSKVFNTFKIKVFKTSFLSAELAKLFNNNYRYIQFAVANQFTIIANNYNQNIHDIIKMCNYNYPRARIYSPGLTGGTCLRKDFGMFNEKNSGADIFLSAWKINEFIPLHLTEFVDKKFKIIGKRIGILGYTFKKDSDDSRESLVPKLIRQIEKKIPKSIVICEPNISSKFIDNYKNLSLIKALKNTDIIFIAIGHSSFKKELILKYQKKIKIVDIWNHLNKNSFII